MSKYKIVQFDTGHYAVKYTPTNGMDPKYMSLNTVGEKYSFNEVGFWRYAVSHNIETVESVYAKLTATEVRVVK